MVGDEERLAFDILNGKLIVVSASSEFSVEAVIQAVACKPAECCC